MKTKDIHSKYTSTKIDDSYDVATGLGKQLSNNAAFITVFMLHAVWSLTGCGKLLNYCENQDNDK